MWSLPLITVHCQKDFVSPNRKYGYNEESLFIDNEFEYNVSNPVIC